MSIGIYGEKIIGIGAEQSQDGFRGSLGLNFDDGRGTINHIWQATLRDGRHFTLGDAIGLNFERNVFDGYACDQDYLRKLNRNIKIAVVGEIARYIASPNDYLMRHLFAVRHGEYKGDNLTPEGKEQVLGAARRIHDIAGAVHLAIVSSPNELAKRARQSADIISSELSLGDVREDACLFTDVESISDCQLEKIEEMCGNVHGPDGLILVTHGPVAEEFTYYVIRNRFQRYPDYVHLDYGQGVHINLHTGTQTDL